jgi:malonate transporter
MRIILLMMPIVAPVVAGYLFVKSGILKEEIANSLLLFLMYVTFPALIVGDLSKETPARLLQINFSLATVAAVAFLYAATFVVHRLVFRRPMKDTAMASLTMSFLSAGIVGLPIMVTIIGAEATLIPVLLNTVISLVTVVPVTILIVRWQQGGGGDSAKALGATLRDVLKNPLVVGSIIGLAVAFLRIPMPHWLLESLQKVGGATFAIALFSVGISLNLKSLKQSAREISFLSFLKMAVFPISGFFFVWTFKLAPAEAVAFMMIIALPTAKVVPAITRDYKTYVNESVAIVTLTTLATAVTMPILLYYCNRFWPGVIK